MGRYQFTYLFDKKAGIVHYAFGLYEDYKSQLDNLTTAELAGQEKNDLDALFSKELDRYDMKLALSKLLHVQDNTIRGKSIHQLLR